MSEQKEQKNEKTHARMDSLHDSEDARTAPTVEPDATCRCGHLASNHCGKGVTREGGVPTACLLCSCGQFLRGQPSLLRRCLEAIEVAITEEEGLDGYVGERLLREAGYWPPRQEKHDG